MSRMLLIFSFVGLSRTLPTTSYAKMIWMMISMLSPFFEVLLHAVTHTLANLIQDRKSSVVQPQDHSEAPMAR
jgi:hypothetical protein